MLALHHTLAIIHERFKTAPVLVLVWQALVLVKSCCAGLGLVWRFWSCLHHRINTSRKM